VRTVTAEPAVASPAAEADVAEPPTASAPAPEANETRPVAARTVSLDVGELRRRWKDVINRVKESRPAASKLFLETEADVDGDTVVVEFDPSRRVLVRAAEEQDVVALLRDSVRDVLGWHVAIRYQLGRGAVRPLGDDPPDPGVESEPAAPTPGSDDGSLDRILIDGLGAEVVSTSSDDDRKDS
jgi:hypothetical protein